MTVNTIKLSGVIPPMITPLTENMEVDVDGLEALVTYMLDGGVGGIFALGSSGEGPWLTSTQQSTVLKTVVDCVKGRVPVLVGALEPSTARTQEVIQRHVNDGADIVVITSPYYFPADDIVQINHIEQLATQSPVPVMLYNIPPTTHNPIVAETVNQVMQMDNLIGIKDSAGDWDNFLKLLEYRKQRPEFCVFQGAEKLAAKSIEAGADGIVPGLGNIVPQHFVAIINAIQAEDPDEASRLQEAIDELWMLHTYDFWMSGLKYAASLLGFGSGAAIGRKIYMNDDAKHKIGTLVDKFGNQTVLNK